MKKLIFILTCVLGLPLLVSAQLSIFRPSQGGTGLGSAVSGDIGKCLTVSNNSPFAYTFATCGGSSFAYPFTKLSTGENATSTTLEFNNGFVSSASSTLTTFTFTTATGTEATTTNFAVTSLASKLIKTSSNGSLIGAAAGTDYASPSITITVAGTANQITSSAGAQDLSANHTWTLSFPSLVVFPSNASSTLFSTIYASTSQLCIGGDCKTAWPAAGSSLAFPFTTGSDWSTHNATSTLIGLKGGLYSLASSTIGNNSVASGLTIFGGATTTSDLLALGSTTLQAFTAFKGTITSATSTNLYPTNLLVLGSTTLQNFIGTSGTTTNEYSTHYLATGSSTFQGIAVTSCTGCSSGGVVPTFYYATTTAGNKSMFKTLTLAAGDSVEFGAYTGTGQSNHGTMGYRISSASWGGPMASTTIVDAGSVTDGNSHQAFGWVFEATSTATITFFYTTGGGGTPTMMWVKHYAGLGYANSWTP